MRIATVCLRHLEFHTRGSLYTLLVIGHIFCRSFERLSLAFGRARQEQSGLGKKQASRVQAFRLAYPLPNA